MVRFNRGRPRTEAEEKVFRVAVGNHVEAFDKAYPDATVKPKHHFMFHTGFFDAWCCERKNATAKTHFQHIDCTREFERFALASLLNEQVRQLQRPTALTDYLQSPLERVPQIAHECGADVAYASVSMVYNGTAVHRNDVVAVEDSVGLVLACLQVDERLCLLLEEWKPLPLQDAPLARAGSPSYHGFAPR